MGISLLSADFDACLISQEWEHNFSKQSRRFVNKMLIVCSLILLLTLFALMSRAVLFFF
jgi:hypothetical protein